MSIIVDLQNNQELPHPSLEQFSSWAKLTLGHENIHIAEVSCYLCTTDEMQSINAEYRQKNKPTNILSFPFEAPPGLPTEIQGNNLLGDLVICPEVIEKEALEQKKDPLHHWAHITIHGILHLLGYDHIKDSDAEVMEALERKILGQLGIKDPYVQL